MCRNLETLEVRNQEESDDECELGREELDSYTQKIPFGILGNVDYAVRYTRTRFVFPIPCPVFPYILIYIPRTMYVLKNPAM